MLDEQNSKPGCRLCQRRLTGSAWGWAGCLRPLLLLHGFRVLIDELHAELARQGHPDMRPMHGFVFQAIGPGGTTAAQLARRLGVSKQAAGKTIDHLERLGYLERAPDPADARRKAVRLTGRAFDALDRSARGFDGLGARWGGGIGG